MLINPEFILTKKRITFGKSKHQKKGGKIMAQFLVRAFWFGLIVALAGGTIYLGLYGVPIISIKIEKKVTP
jgi:phenylalanine-4-hydroxylase